MLVEKGADLNTANMDGDTALHLTFKNFKDEEAKERIAVMLVEKGADLNTANMDGDTALHCTMPDGADLNTANMDGDTALHLTFKHFKDQEAKGRIAVMLVEKGADLNTANMDGDTALHCTMKYVKDQEAMERIANDERITPLMIASIRGFSRITILISRGADLNAIDDKGNAPFHYAIQNKKIAIADVLIEFGADVTKRN
ncbi:hypothetical protein CAPTEDRAFT_92953, partial [Capitella teleta]